MYYITIALMTIVLLIRLSLSISLYVCLKLWKREVEEVTRKEKLAESQRDEVSLLLLVMSST